MNKQDNFLTKKDIFDLTTNSEFVAIRKKYFFECDNVVIDLNNINE